MYICIYIYIYIERERERHYSNNHNNKARSYYNIIRDYATCMCSLRYADSI